MTDSEQSTIDQVLQAESDRCQAIKDEDWTRLDALLADDLTYGHSNGKIETKAEFMGNITNRKTTIERHNLMVHAHGDVGIMTGGLSMYMEGYEGQDFVSLDMITLQVWVRRDGNWQMAAYQCARNTIGAG